MGVGAITANGMQSSNSSYVPVLLQSRYLLWTITSQDGAARQRQGHFNKGSWESSSLAYLYILPLFTAPQYMVGRTVLRIPLVFLYKCGVLTSSTPELVHIPVHTHMWQRHRHSRTGGGGYRCLGAEGAEMVLTT